jgi:hypothetical protein
MLNIQVINRVITVIVLVATIVGVGIVAGGLGRPVTELAYHNPTGGGGGGGC